MLVPVVVVVAACSGEASPTSTATSSTVPDESTTVPQQECGAIPYEVEVLPDRVQGERPPTDDVPQDVFTTVPGTVSRLWFDGDGELAVVLARGSLPPMQWPEDGERGEVSIDGARGVAGQLDDGTWMIGWFEGEGEPCDRYFMVFYPPVEATEVSDTIGSLNRTAG